MKKTTMPSLTPELKGIEHLASAVLLCDIEGHILYMNPSAEILFGLSAKHIYKMALDEAFPHSDILKLAISQALNSDTPYREHEFLITTLKHQSYSVTCTITPIQTGSIRYILEFQQMDQQLRIAKEERMLIQQQANSELIRNLAHEIRNPLGQVIIKEADRLQSLMDRLLVPHQKPKYEPTNIHEVLERVRSLLLAESPDEIKIQRDYDTSLPDIVGDREKLIQAVLNIARNAVQAMHEKQQQGLIIFKTRAERQIMLAKKRYRVGIKLDIIDNGPGIPAGIRDKIFYPLVSGREGGSGLGLSLAQTYVSQHQGMIECKSEPGQTTFTILLPIKDLDTKDISIHNQESQGSSL
jgi:two-component system nitrogen regulation sensor histidine kinase GlnL